MSFILHIRAIIDCQEKVDMLGSYGFTCETQISRAQQRGFFTLKNPL